MLILTLDDKTGSLYLDGLIFKYDTEFNYLKTIKELLTKLDDSVMCVNGFNKYGGYDVEFCANIFSVEFVFKDGLLYSNSYIYNGLASENGFGATENDQKKDRIKLRSDFEVFLGKAPDKKLKNRDLYVYSWGEVRVSQSHRDYYVFLNFEYY